MNYRIEKCTDSTFVYTNTHPSGIAESSYAASAVNAAAIASGLPWERLFKSLFDQAHKLGLMPGDARCVRGMLTENGFFRQPSSKNKRMTTNEVREYLSAHLVDGVSAVVKTPRYGYGGDMTAVIRTEVNSTVYCLAGFRDNSDMEAEEIWLRWPDGLNHGSASRRSRPAAAKSKQRSTPESSGHYQFHQENPGNNFIGDCVVRGISSVCGISWHETIDALSRYGHTTINSMEVFPKFLRERGFSRCGPLRKNNRRLTASEFCMTANNRYHDGERILAFIGSSHVAAIIPVKNADGMRKYEIMDTWNCSDRPVTEFWISKGTDSEEQVPAKAQKIFAIGEKILHPAFGTGVVISAPGDDTQTSIEVDFPEAGTKKLSCSWAAEHCVPSVDNAC